MMMNDQYQQQLKDMDKHMKNKDINLHAKECDDEMAACDKG